MRLLRLDGRGRREEGGEEEGEGESSLIASVDSVIWRCSSANASPLLPQALRRPLQDL